MSENPAPRTMDSLRAIVQRTSVDAAYTYDSGRLVDEKLRFIADNCPRVLDVGKSTRERFSIFRPGQAVTMDINQYGDYPDVVDDLCDIRTLEWSSFDAIVCFSILEHVYAPHLACESLHKLLRPGGFVFVYVPFLFRYHAPSDGSYQDYFRFSADALGYLFRDFSEVTIYPFRGRYSTMLNLSGFWKSYVERAFGQGLNKALDRLLGMFSDRSRAQRQASGYYLWATKPQHDAG